MMVGFGILTRLEAKPGKETAVVAFLQKALPLAEDEPGTVSWHAMQLSSATFGIFATFVSEADRQAHLDGNIAIALAAETPELFVVPPRVDHVQVIAAKYPATAA